MCASRAACAGSCCVETAGVLPNPADAPNREPPGAGDAPNREPPGAADDPNSELPKGAGAPNEENPDSEFGAGAGVDPNSPPDGAGAGGDPNSPPLEGAGVEPNRPPPPPEGAGAGAPKAGGAAPAGAPKVWVVFAPQVTIFWIDG